MDAEEFMSFGIDSDFSESEETKDECDDVKSIKSSAKTNR